MSHMKNINGNEISGFQTLAFEIGYYQMVLFTHLHKFSSLTYTGKKMGGRLFLSFFMVLSSKMKPIFGLACHMLILLYCFLIMCSQSDLPFVKQ